MGETGSPKPGEVESGLCGETRVRRMLQFSRTDEF